MQEFNLLVKPEAKPSSLRSVRVKSERMRDNSTFKEKVDNELPVKMESPEESDVKPAISLNSKTVPSKDSEPLTSAVAPVAQMETSPVECKEEGASLKTEEAASASKDREDQEDDDDVVEVPYKPQVNAETNGTDITTMQDVKKRKLDILKEGGLEVTPVAPVKDIRPSVIQQAAAPRCVSVDAQHMPPPPSSNVPIKRTPIVVSNKQFNYLNGQSPPKVVQSKSIYSYSEKTVYGNPKMLPPPVAAPRIAVTRQNGGEVLDLRVTSPQKPVVEIMRVPLNLKNSPRKQTTPPSPLIEGRKIGSNLEITLVGPQKSPYSVQKYNKRFPTHKRTLSDNYTNSKYTKLEENGKNVRLMVPQHNGLEITVPNPYTKNPPPSQPSNSKQFPSTVPRPPPLLTNYLPMVQTTNKPIPPFMPMVDPLYLSALQSMYNPNSVPPPPPPLFPMATPEQLQLYSELMAQNARARYTFPFPDGNPSVTTENKKL